ncbi:MAG: DUF1275 domain-containing protein [Oscillibacter sp.]|nr:DUF1275 domain-containing protein [Oscillibacter sp.]
MNNQQRSAFQRSESFAVGAFLAVAGGFLDAYTYLCRGGVFANAQTGNMVLLAIHTAQGQWQRAGYDLIPILAFFFGVLAVEFIKAHNQGQPGKVLHWRHTVLLVEMGTLVAVSFVPQGDWNPVVNILVSFVCAMQVETFRKVRGNPFASTMCTGNLRSGTEALFLALRRHDRAFLKKSGCYFGIIACFIAGAALGTAVSGLFPRRALLIGAAFQLVAFLWMVERPKP